MNQSVSTLTGKIKMKIVFLGNQAVGKSSVIEKYVHNRFQQSSHPTVGIDFLAKNIAHKNKNYRLQLWDTAGQQRFKSLIPSYLRDAQCALILFDVTNKLTFQNVQNWLQMYNDNKTGNGFTLLIGNKIDLERDRQVSVQQGTKKAEQLGMPYFQISAKTGQNVEALFSNLLDIVSQNSIDAAKFNLNKISQPSKIQEVQQKNEQDKQNKQNKPPLDKKLKPVSKQANNSTQNQSNNKNNKENVQDSKTIRLQNKKQKPKMNKKGCC